MSDLTPMVSHSLPADYQRGSLDMNPTGSLRHAPQGWINTLSSNVSTMSKRSSGKTVICIYIFEHNCSISS